MSKQTNERSEQTSEQTSERPSTYVPILGCSARLCDSDNEAKRKMVDDGRFIDATTHVDKGSYPSVDPCFSNDENRSF